MAISGGADAAFAAGLRVPRRWKAVDSCFAAAAAAQQQGFILHRSAGSSTQLEELGREPADVTAAGAQPSAFSDPALAAASAQNDAAASGRPQFMSDEGEEGATPLPPHPPACLLQPPESAQSSATWLPALDESPGSEPEVWQLRGVAARLQLRVRVAAEQRDPAAAKPSLREVAAFQHPLAEGSGRESSRCRPHADIVCDVKFCPDGELIATAGVGKQVCARRDPPQIGYTPRYRV